MLGRKCADIYITVCDCIGDFCAVGTNPFIKYGPYPDSIDFYRNSFEETSKIWWSIQARLLFRAISTMTQLMKSQKFHRINDAFWNRWPRNKNKQNNKMFFHFLSGRVISSGCHRCNRMRLLSQFRAVECVQWSLEENLTKTETTKNHLLEDLLGGRTPHLKLSFIGN